MMENETKIKWVDENLGSLVVELFEETKQALIHRNIPNYFIRANNMISHRSQSEIEFTLAEMSKLISKPFTILSIICQKLQFYHKVAKYSHQLSEEKVENASCLELYSVLVTILYNMGMDKLTVIEMLSSRCFELICKINIAMRQFPRNGPVFTSESVPDLLIPSALKYCQLGKVNEALALHHVIYKNASQEHLVKYPQILTNLGCLYNVVASEGQSANAENRKECLKKAQSYFEKSQELNGASHEFAFTYANFLYSNKISISKALRYFQLASEIKPEPGKEIYINVDIPHVEGTKTEMIDSISASYYFLALCYHDMLDIYSERHILRKFAEVCERVPIDKRSTVLALCAICHASCGLRIKAEELAKECNKVESAVRTKNSKQGGSQFL